MMDTEITFLTDLREDLLDAAWRQQMSPTPSKRRPRALLRATVLGGAAVAALLGGRLLMPHLSGSPSSAAVPVNGGQPGGLDSQKLENHSNAPTDGASWSTEPGWRGAPAGNDDAFSPLPQHSAPFDYNKRTTLGAEKNPNIYSAGTVVQAADASGGSAPDSGGSGAGPAISLDHVVKTASMSVVVGRNGFQAALQAANGTAAKYGGYVQNSSTSGARAGTVTIRIPADQFEAAMGDLQALGRVETEASDGQDVSADYVDLSARLRIAEQREAVLSRLMERAHGVSEILRLRDVLEQAQLDVEQLKGTLRVLRNRSALGTIALSLREEGVSAAEVNPGSDTSVGSAFRHFASGFSKVLFALIVGLGYALPVLFAAGLGWFAFRRFRPKT